MRDFYKLKVAESAYRELTLIPNGSRHKLLNDIEYLTINPYSDRSRRIRETSLYRLRIEDWRVLYSVDDQNRTITIYAIRKKRDLRL